MRINKVNPQTSFKSVYQVETLKLNIDKTGISVLMPDQENTKQLFNLLNPSGKNKDIVLMKKSSWTNCVDVSSPPLILLNDESKDAKEYVDLGKKYQKAKARLKKLSDKTLEKMLNERELNALKNPDISFIKNHPHVSYRDSLIDTIDERRLQVNRMKEEEVLYRKFIKKAIPVSPKDIQTIREKAALLALKIIKKA